MNAKAFTIIPRNWRFTAEELESVIPLMLMAALRTALYGRGAGTAKGWLICFLHGEYEPNSRTFQIHVHGFAYGEMVHVIDRLRKLPNYKTKQFGKDGRINPVYRPVQIRRKPPENLRRQIAYRLQSYWPSKAIVFGEDGSRIRAKRRRRIVEPYHSQVLLWLDRWELTDLTLMIGLRVAKHGLIQTKRPS